MTHSLLKLAPFPRGWQIIAPICLLTIVFSGSALAQRTDELVQDNDYVLGVQAFADGDFERAANLWLADAYKGSADAQFNVGVLYVEGKGVAIDRGEAAFWFEKAAEQGHPEAQYNLGHLLLEEQGDVERIGEGIEWWRKSAEQDFAIAQYNYGRAVYFGIGVDQDRAAAKVWIEKAKEAGNKRAEVFYAEYENKFVDEPIADSATKQVIVDAATPPREEQPPSEEVVKRSEYLLVGDQPILMYSRFNVFAPIVTRVDAKVLLRVVERARNWIRVEVPGGIPGWIKRDRLEIDKDLVEVLKGETKVRADPTESTENNDIGELSAGARVLLLEQQAGWVRVLLPEKIPGWIEEESVKTVTADSSEIARVWQTQRVRLKIEALSSREIKIAASEVEPVILPIDSTDSKLEKIDLQTESVLATVARVEPLVEDKQEEVIEEPEVDIALADFASDEISLPAQELDPVDSAVQGTQPEELTTEAAQAVEEAKVASATVEEIVVVGSAAVLESGVIGVREEGAGSTGSDAPPETVQISEPEQVLAEATGAVESTNPNPGKAAEPDVVVNPAVVKDSGDAKSDEDSGDTEAVVDDVNSTIRLSNKSGVAVRTGASRSTPSVTTLPLNTLVDMIGQENGFAKVIIPGGLPVWIRRSEALIQGGENALIKGSRVRALSLPPGESETRILGLLPAGEVVRVVNERGTALRIVAPESITGWISLSDLKLTNALVGLDKVWQEQSYTLLTSYLDAELQEMAVVPTLGDNHLVGTGIPNDNNWLFEDTSKGYTLQLFSMQNQSSGRSQFRSLNGRGQFFSTRVRGESWYFVLLGKFLTADAAKAVAEKLPRWASGWRVRSLQRLQVNRCKKLDQFSEQEAFGLAAKCS